MENKVRHYPRIEGSHGIRGMFAIMVDKVHYDGIGDIVEPIVSGPTMRTHRELVEYAKWWANLEGIECEYN